VAEAAPVAPVKPSASVRLAVLPAIRSPRVPAGLLAPISLVRQIETASPVTRRFALAPVPEMPAPGRLRAVRLARELAGLRDYVKPGLPFAVTAEINKPVASDLAARRSAPVLVAAAGKPRRKRATIVRLLGETSQSFLPKKN